MAHWNTLGLRGSTLEELINLTNENYQKKKLAIIQKISTPITPVKIDNESRNISLAYFNAKSTVDYIGAVQGYPVCFDAKQTSGKYLPLQNIHPHQMEFMEGFENQGGISFLLVYFSKQDEYFLLPFKKLKEFWDGAREGGRKSIPYESFDQRLRIYNKQGYYLHYLEALDAFMCLEKETD